jgi:hypothetical protein
MRARTGGRAVRDCVGMLLLLSASPPDRLSAQDSQFSVRGLGVPGRWESVRARTTGGAFGPFDSRSATSDASLADAVQLTATAVEATTYRRAVVDGATTDLRSSRFPFMGLAGPLSRRFVVGGGFATYLDRTYEVATRDSQLLRGVYVPYTDHLGSDGAVVDLRFAAAARLASRVAIGAGVHVLTGSTRMTAQRVYDDTSYQGTGQVAVVRYDGVGVSGSVALDPLSTLRIVGYGRTDNRLRARLGDEETDRSDLPTTLGGALRWWPSPSARVAGTVEWRSWSDAGGFNTLSWSAGAEVGGRTTPFRFGVRGGQLPFGPGAVAPTEFGIAAGWGKGFSGGNALLDFGLERLVREGGGMTETAWTVLVGLTIRP